jgi:hypothetical protein
MESLTFYYGRDPDANALYHFALDVPQAVAPELLEACVAVRHAHPTWPGEGARLARAAGAGAAPPGPAPAPDG